MWIVVRQLSKNLGNVCIYLFIYVLIYLFIPSYFPFFCPPLKNTGIGFIAYMILFQFYFNLYWMHNNINLTYEKTWFMPDLS